MTAATTKPGKVVPALAKRAVIRALRSRAVNAAMRRLACARGHRLVLVYHRLGPVSPDCQVVPTVPVDLFKSQLQALGEVVELVGMDDVLDESTGRGARRVAIAITFDDDLPSHATQALPVLREIGVPAAFFLSGRMLNGLGPYWFQELEALVLTHGTAGTAGQLGLPSGHSHRPSDLALACERNPELRRRVSDLSAGVRRPGLLDRDGIAALADGGMTIGFHTVDHPVLPDLNDSALDDAVSRGRDLLAAAAGNVLRYFAYPHGKADARSIAAVRRAGFDAGFTGQPEPLRPRGDRFRIGRWEPGPLSVDELLVQLAIRLHRGVPETS